MTQVIAMADQYGDGWKVPHIPNPGETPDPRFVPHPLKTGQQPVASRNPAALALPQTFIFCTQDKDLMLLGQPIVEAARDAKVDEAWQYFELQTDHIPMENSTEELVELFNRIAAQAEVV